MNFYRIFPSLKTSIMLYSFLSAFSRIYTVREEIIHTWEICHNFSIYTTTLWKITQHNVCNCKPYESCRPYASLEFLLSFQKQWEDNSETRKCTRNTPKRQNSEHNENPLSTPLQPHLELSSKPHLLCKEQNSIHSALSINRPSTNIVLKFKHNPVPPAHTQILSDLYFAVITGLSSSTCCYLTKHSKKFKEQERNFIHAISRNNFVGVECMPIEVLTGYTHPCYLLFRIPHHLNLSKTSEQNPKPAVVSILHKVLATAGCCNSHYYKRREWSWSWENMVTREDNKPTWSKLKGRPSFWKLEMTAFAVPDVSTLLDWCDSVTCRQGSKQKTLEPFYTQCSYLSLSTSHVNFMLAVSSA